jgi:dolichol-phosphate mannosyltransferase
LKTILIIPTYNESANIGDLIEALQIEFRSMHHEMHILVVDDCSPDGTAGIVREKQEIYSNVHLILGQKIGLGTAYIRGMTFAIDQLKADVVFEMDGDFSHKPDDVPRLMAALEEGADFAIGSRYIRGGTIPGQWGLFRRLNSYFGNVMARYIAGLYMIRDCTAGFRAIRTSLLRQIRFDGLRVQGYAFQVALLYEAFALGAKIKEIPVDFLERLEGESKLGISDIIEFVANVWWIRMGRLKIFLKFGVVGLSGIVVNLAVFTLLLELGMNRYLASPIAIEMSIISNFCLNNYWTFRLCNTSAGLGLKGIKFNAVSLLALGLSFSTFVLLSIMFPTTHPQIHQLFGIGPAMLVNYFLNSYWTFEDDRFVNAHDLCSGRPHQLK